MFHAASRYSLLRIAQWRFVDSTKEYGSYEQGFCKDYHFFMRRQREGITASSLQHIVKKYITNLLCRLCIVSDVTQHQCVTYTSQPTRIYIRICPKLNKRWYNA